MGWESRRPHGSMPPHWAGPRQWPFVFMQKINSCPPRKCAPSLPFKLVPPHASFVSPIHLLSLVVPPARARPPGPLLAMATHSVTIRHISAAGITTSVPIPVHQLSKSLVARRRSHPAPATSSTAQLMLRTLTSQMVGSFPSSNLLSLLNMVRKPSTLNGKVPYFLKGQAFCRSRGLPIFPASLLAVAAFLFESASGDHTASPTLNRCSAISFVCHMSGTVNPMDHPLCIQVNPKAWPPWSHTTPSCQEPIVTDSVPSSFHPSHPTYPAGLFPFGTHVCRLPSLA